MLRIGVPCGRMTGRGEIEVAGLGEGCQITLVIIDLGAHTITDGLEKKLSTVDDHTNSVVLRSGAGVFLESGLVVCVSCHVPPFLTDW